MPCDSDVAFAAGRSSAGDPSDATIEAEFAGVSENRDFEGELRDLQDSDGRRLFRAQAVFKCGDAPGGPAREVDELHPRRLRELRGGGCDCHLRARGRQRRFELLNGCLRLREAIKSSTGTGSQKKQTGSHERELKRTK